ncbi:MAG: hypothetical protein LBO20_04140 [Bifidobacteriaceae bacterium]|jgi:hypothetical protein|nr:hypothetical protein [Bifidobacteriaceae bacterium]
MDKFPPPRAAACQTPDPATGSESTPLKDGGGWLELPTYDGSGQATHLNVQFNQTGMAGHPYWMTMTPYPYREDSKENPSVLVSDNGLDWVEPTSGVNPVSGYPPDVGAGGHYSDGYLLPRDGGFELWFRHNPAKQGDNKPDNSRNILYRMTSQDGVAWSDPETVFDGGESAYMSPSLMAHGAGWRLWYSNYGGEIIHQRSQDLKNWSEPELVEIKLTENYLPWHQEIVATDIGYEALVLGYRQEADGPFSFALYYAASQDGVKFGQASLLRPADVDPQLDGYSFYKSSLVKRCGVYQLYLSAVAADGAQRAFYKQIPVESLPDLFAGPAGG